MGLPVSTNQTHKFEKKWLYYSKLFAHLSGRSKGWDWSIQCVRRWRFGRIVDCNAILWAFSWLLMGKEELHSYWRCTVIKTVQKSLMKTLKLSLRGFLKYELFPEEPMISLRQVLQREYNEAAKCHICMKPFHELENSQKAIGHCH